MGKLYKNSPPLPLCNNCNTLFSRSHRRQLPLSLSPRTAQSTATGATKLIAAVSPYALHHQALQVLDLLGAPASVRLAHIGGRLDGRDVLEGDVDNADDADEGASQYPQDVGVEQEGADEDVDYEKGVEKTELE